jgi:hypothetical protein
MSELMWHMMERSHLLMAEQYSSQVLVDEWHLHLLEQAEGELF